MAVQEMLHLQQASNICYSFGVAPSIPQLNIAPGQQITVSHLEPTPGQPLLATIGNLPGVMDALVAIEKPAAQGFVGINSQVIYPSIADLYHATLLLLLLARDLRAYGGVPAGSDPQFQPNNKQVNFGTFETTYPDIHAIATRADVVAAANAICDQGEGGLVAASVGGLFKSSPGSDSVLPQFQPVKGSRFAKWGALTRYNRFVDVQAQIAKLAGNSEIAHAATNPCLRSGAPLFYQANGQQSPDLPAWALTTTPPVTATVLGISASTYPVVLHGASLSIGSCDPLNRDYLAQLKHLARETHAAWVSDHLCWTGVAGQTTHDLPPLPLNEETLAHVVQRIRTVQDVLERPLVIENPSSYAPFTADTLPEWGTHVGGSLDGRFSCTTPQRCCVHETLLHRNSRLCRQHSPDGVWPLYALNTDTQDAERP